MNENQDKNQTKVIMGKFKTDSQSQSTQNERIFKNQSNPIKKNLVKFIHNTLSSNKTGSPSFSRFKPEDLR